MVSRAAVVLLAISACAVLLLAIGVLHHSQIQWDQEVHSTVWGSYLAGSRASDQASLQRELRQEQQLRRSLQDRLDRGCGHQSWQTAASGQLQGTVYNQPSFPADSRGWAAYDEATLAQLPRNGTLFVSFSNAHYGEFLINWAAHLSLIGAAHLVVSFDSKTAAICREHGIQLMPYDTNLAAENMRNNGTKFRELATQKPRIVQQLFETHGFQTIVLTDTDTVWLRHPDDYIAQHPLADMLISTDCASPKAEMDVAKNTPRCGHIAGSTCCHAYNTGILVLRNRPATLALMAAWHKRLASPDSQEASKDGEYLKQFYRIGDQVMLNEVMMRGGHQPIVPLEADPALSRCFHARVAVHPLPALLFANGYTNFIQRLPDRYNVMPYVVHATFQRDENAGKKSRFREWGWWHTDPPEYYSQGNFISYNNGVQAFIDVAVAGYKGGRMVPFHRHQLAASYQLAAFQHALAIARALNRTLILPQMWCWCDQDADAAILATCVNAGTELELPYRCPVDHMVVMSKVEASGASLRHPNFLQHPEVPAAVKQSVSPVVMHPAQAPLPEFHPAARFAAHVQAGLTDQQLKDELRPWDSVRVLHWQNFEPGAFGGFVDPQANAALDKMYHFLTYYQGWCCSGGYWVDKFELVNWPYVQPPDLGAAMVQGKLDGKWRLPVFTKPTWCNELKPDNLRFTRLPNHPCKYLGDPNYGPRDGNSSGWVSTGAGIWALTGGAK